MEALYLLVPLSIVVVAVALWIFFGGADSGQFEDLSGPALRVLRDDDSVELDLARSLPLRAIGSA